MARASKMKAPPFGKKADSEEPKKGKKGVNPFAKKDAGAEADPEEGDEMDSIFGESSDDEDTAVVTLADATTAQLEDELAKRQEEEDNSESEDDDMDSMFGGETDEEDVV